MPDSPITDVATPVEYEPPVVEDLDTGGEPIGTSTGVY